MIRNWESGGGKDVKVMSKVFNTRPTISLHCLVTSLSPLNGKHYEWPSMFPQFSSDNGESHHQSFSPQFSCDILKAQFVIKAIHFLLKKSLLPHFLCIQLHGDTWGHTYLVRTAWQQLGGWDKPHVLPMETQSLHLWAIYWEPSVSCWNLSLRFPERDSPWNRFPGIWKTLSFCQKISESIGKHTQ